jgi:hypothetical protein
MPAKKASIMLNYFLDMPANASLLLGVKQKAPLPAVTGNEAKSSSGVSRMPNPNRIIGFPLEKASRNERPTD